LLLGISLLTFAMAHLAPGDPISTQFGLDLRGMEPETVDRLRDTLRLNDPLPVQYLRYLGNLIRGDLGWSLTTRAPVSQEISARFPATLELALAAMAIVVSVAIPLGIVSAVKRGSLLDLLGMFGAVLGVSIPNFWFGLMLMLLFSPKLGWLPSGGRGDGTLLSTLRSLVLPAVTLGTGMLGQVSRMMREHAAGLGPGLRADGALQGSGAATDLGPTQPAQLAHSRDNHPGIPVGCLAGRHGGR
jgi:peptide/nickel transport system permease protein